MSESRLTKNQLLVKIDQLTASFEEQKENYTNEVCLLKENYAKEKHEKEIERNDNMYKKHEYEYELMQQTINYLEQTISDLQSRINDNISTPELY
ncbi:400_t:CDS:2 [Scutellospora calospora]|uniref:400_t:CDS:1 n=1 Tax=Scutellospora calospora TaxID=85575 RepID=A0ACA9NNF7_9GLOM|nr:400_t:CDS:2 [Scutellospora calospora]